MINAQIRKVHVNEAFLGIGEAAKLLGLSKTSLQKLVDAGKIPAVKTAGGHRRLSREAVEAVNSTTGPLSLLGQVHPLLVRQNNDKTGALTVLLVEDDAPTAALLTNVFKDFFPSARLLLATDGLDAILLLERDCPQVLITDLSMEPFDGFRLLQLLTRRVEFQAIALVAISGMSEQEIAQRGGLPSHVLFLNKPIDLQRLRGFVDAHVQLRLARFVGNSLTDASMKEAVPV